MIKKSVLFIFILLVFSYGLFSFEAGVTIGNISNPSQMTYGLSGSMGFLVPMLKFEMEIYRKANTDALAFDLKNGATTGIKFRPKMGKFGPYAIIGVGADFEKLGFDSDNYENFSFIGGGIHYYAAGIISLRADVRFLNYSGYNRTRFTAGLFFHF